MDGGPMVDYNAYEYTVAATAVAAAAPQPAQPTAAPRTGPAHRWPVFLICLDVFEPPTGASDTLTETLTKNNTNRNCDFSVITSSGATPVRPLQTKLK